VSAAARRSAAGRDSRARLLLAQHACGIEASDAAGAARPRRRSGFQVPRCAGSKDVPDANLCAGRCLRQSSQPRNVRCRTVASRMRDDSDSGIAR